MFSGNCIIPSLLYCVIYCSISRNLFMVSNTISNICSKKTWNINKFVNLNCENSRSIINGCDPLILSAFKNSNLNSFLCSIFNTSCYIGIRFFPAPSRFVKLCRELFKSKETIELLQSHKRNSNKIWLILVSF